MGVDDTGLRKTGRTILQAFYQRDPLSPPFWVNLMFGLRFPQAALLVPLYRQPAYLLTTDLTRISHTGASKKPPFLA